MRISRGRIAFNIVNYSILAFIAVLTLYPFLHVAASSLSSLHSVMRGEVGIIPRDISFSAYKLVLGYPMIGTAYKNTIIYTVLGTAINLLFTVPGAYALSRKKFQARKVFSLMIVFAMLFNAGMIPNFLVVKGLGMYNTLWAMVIPGAVSMWFIIIMRTFFQNIPDSLEESAYIDGANDIQILIKIIIPLSVPSIMAIGLFYAVGHWNKFFHALIYLQDEKKWPLQILLRQLVIQSEGSEMMASEDNASTVGETVKYATIMVATIPIVMVYPFIQKYFVKGVMIGAVKG
jgi:putative aldouronate transport system permease protein